MRHYSYFLMAFLLTMTVCAHALADRGGVRQVADFGAMGDGDHDDTAAIQEAVKAGAGTLVFGPGTYRVSKPIIINLEVDGPLGIRGEGGAQLVMHGAGPTLHIIGTHRGTASPASVQPVVWERERMPQVTGLEILGAHPEADGIRLERTMQCVITKTLIRKCRHAIHLVERNRNFILSDAHLYENIETGVFFDEVNLHQVNIIGNHISYSGRAGIYVLGGEVRNLQITGNDIEYNHQGMEDVADILFDTRTGTLREFTIASNTIQAATVPGGANIRILGSESDLSDQSGLGAITGNLIGSQSINIDLSHTRGVTISGNSIYSAADLSLRARHCRNLTLTGNTVDYNPGVEDRMRDGFLFESCDTVVVSASTFVDCRWGDETGGGAITLLDCRHVLIGNCVIINPAVRGIDVQRSTTCHIANNLIIDNRPEPTMLAAIAVDEHSTGIVTTPNQIVPAINQEPTALRPIPDETR